ncbi:hypothetical protein BH18ACI4_BH18ACI4_08710 [soil metagenome]
MKLAQAWRREPQDYNLKLQPQRLGKRKRVTVIAGFQCRNGLLLCADSEQSLSSESKSQVRKLTTETGYNCAIAIGGAGDGDLIDYVQYRLVENLKESPTTLEQADAWLNEFAKKMWRELIQPYRGFPREFIPEVSFLIGLHMHATYRLYKWERNFVYPVPPKTHVSIGIGVVQSETLLSELQFSLPADQMLLYAVRVMLKVKRLVQGCGGKTEMALLHNDGVIIKPATETIDALESLIDELDNFVLERILRLICNPKLLDDPLEASAQDDSVRYFQNRYKELSPRFFKQVFGTF